ncbi:uncharacterized protein PV07_05222 [Cladophialophora immunda]|uniref:Uncharacterized protein n=1 Tax=Cladophialophora immunda TaxID=569365 RepID=A0A0D1ZN81_9EURO|nr:uncharacterized protein PV07_05222 [Cladophialophora immunda]KIW29406.1 hypothetical protein PV07_05222 [Cladophialophora immunda]
MRKMERGSNMVFFGERGLVEGYSVLGEVGVTDEAHLLVYLMDAPLSSRKPGPDAWQIKWSDNSRGGESFLEMHEPFFFFCFPKRSSTSETASLFYSIRVCRGPTYVLGQRKREPDRTASGYSHSDP